jgi:hypothetical protein
MPRARLEPKLLTDKDKNCCSHGIGEVDRHTYLLKKGIARNISVAATLKGWRACRRISVIRILNGDF